MASHSLASNCSDTRYVCFDLIGIIDVCQCLAAWLDVDTHPHKYSVGILGRSPIIVSQFKGTSRRLTALTVATTLCTLALVFLAVNNSPYHQPQQNIQLFISAAALLTGCLLVGMQGAAAAGALCTSYSFLHRQQRSSTFSARGRGQQLSQRSRIHHLRNGPLTTSTLYDPAKHKSYRLIIEPPPGGDKQLGSPPVPKIPSSPFAVSTDNDKGKSLQRTKAPTAEMVAEAAFERHASQFQVNRGEDGGGRPRHTHDKSASGTIIDDPVSEAAPPQTPAPVASSKPRHTDLHARLSAAYAPTTSSLLISKSRSDDAAADLLYSMQDPHEHRRTMEAMGDGEEEAHRNPLLFFANEDND